MKTNLRKALTIILCAFLLLPILASCADSQSPGPTPSGRPSATPTSAGSGGGGSSGSPGGTLRIAAVNSYGLKELAGGFMLQNPDVTIELDCAFGPDDLAMDAAEIEAKIDAFLRRIQLEMENGEGPDVLSVYGMRFYDLFAQGFFDDLYTYMDDDPNFERADYFENIFTALEYHEGLFAFPTTVNIPYVLLNTTITDALGIDAHTYAAITPMQVLEIYGRALDEGLIDENFRLDTADGGKSALWQEWDRYWDMKAGTARYDSPEFIAYLEASARVQTQREASYHMYSTGSSGIVREPLYEGVNALTFISNLRIHEVTGPSFYWNSKFSTGAIPLMLEENGEGRTFLANDLLSIVANSQNKERAWEFIKYCVAEGENVQYGSAVGMWYGDRFATALPINRNNLKKYAEAYAKKQIVGMSGITVEQIYMTGYEIIENWLGMVDTSPLFFEIGNFDDILTEFYDKQTITAQECAQQIQARAEEILGG